MTEKGLQEVLNVLKEKMKDFDEAKVIAFFQGNNMDDSFAIQAAQQFQGGSMQEWVAFLNDTLQNAVKIAVTSQEDAEIILIGEHIKIGFEQNTILLLVDNEMTKEIGNVKEKIFDTEIPTLRDATLLSMTMFIACGLQEFYTMREPFIEWMRRVARNIGLEGFDHRRAISVLQQFKSKDPFDFSYLLFGGGRNGEGEDIKVLGGLFGFNYHSIRCNGSGIELFDYFEEEEYKQRENFTIMYWMGVLALVGNGCFVNEHTVVMRLQPNMPAVPLVSQDPILEDLEKFEDDLCTVV